MTPRLSLSFGECRIFVADNATVGSRVAAALHDAFPAVTFDFTTKVEHLLQHRALLPELVAHGATSIAEHPKIPAAQVQLVAAELGPEMAAFKQLDNVVHDLSLEIGAAAQALNRDAAISSYQRMIEGCLDCHRTYKERVAAVLKPEPEPQAAL